MTYLVLATVAKPLDSPKIVDDRHPARSQPFIVAGALVIPQDGVVAIAVPVGRVMGPTVRLVAFRAKGEDVNPRNLAALDRPIPIGVKRMMSFSGGRSTENALVIRERSG
jgi:hypothetical protein